jgi:hypothetical protein
VKAIKNLKAKQAFRQLLTFLAVSLLIDLGTD